MFILNQTDSIANQFLSELRDASIQSDRLRFRKNMERLGEIMAYEISKSFAFSPSTIKTPLQHTQVNLLNEQPILLSVLRAAIPFHQGFLNFFDQADCGFIGASRIETESINNEIKIGYFYQAFPSIEQKEVLLIDPMLATGKSMLTCIQNLLKTGNPKRIHIVSIIGAPEGVEYIQKNVKIPLSIWLCALDEKLNWQSYIIPGLGDAGDLAFGNKL